MAVDELDEPAGPIRAGKARAVAILARNAVRELRVAEPAPESADASVRVGPSTDRAHSASGRLWGAMRPKLDPIRRQLSIATVTRPVNPLLSELPRRVSATTEPDPFSA